MSATETWLPFAIGLIVGLLLDIGLQVRRIANK